MMLLFHVASKLKEQMGWGVQKSEVAGWNANNFLSEKEASTCRRFVGVSPFHCPKSLSQTTTVLPLAAPMCDIWFSTSQDFPEISVDIFPFIPGPMNLSGSVCCYRDQPWVDSFLPAIWCHHWLSDHFINWLPTPQDIAYRIHYAYTYKII